MERIVPKIVRRILQQKVVLAVSRRLDRIEDLEKRVRQAHYRIDEFVKLCGTTDRNARDYISHKFHVPLHVWIHKIQCHDADALLAEGKSVKDAGLSVGFKSASHFSHVYKQVCGFSPSAFRSHA
jgi:AraC-like DNA-binding protein